MIDRSFPAIAAAALALAMCAREPLTPSADGATADAAGPAPPTTSVAPLRPPHRPGEPVIRVVGGALTAPDGLPDGALRVGVIGDSITQGGAFPERFPRTLARLLDEAAPGSVVEAHGVPGDTCGRLAERFGAAILDRDPPYDVVIVQCGINDLHNGQDPARIAQALDGMIAAAEQAAIAVVLLTAGPIWGHPGWDAEAEERRAALNEWIMARPGVVAVDVAAALAAGDPPALRPEFVHRDALHPNRDGQDEIAHAIFAGAFADGWRVAGPGIRYRWTD